MAAGIEPRSESDPGYIVAWRSKKKFEAGRFSEEVMTFGEARRKAEELSSKDPDKTYWAQALPQKFEPH